MARINRTDVIQKAVNDLALSTAHDLIPSETLDKVQCTYSLNKQFSNFVISANGTASGNVSIDLSKLPGDVYITGMQLTLAKDATCDMADGVCSLAITDERGQVMRVLHIPVITLTAQFQNAELSLPYPIKILRGSSATCLTASHSVGKRVLTGSIIGFNTSANNQ